MQIKIRKVLDPRGQTRGFLENWSLLRWMSTKLKNMAHDFPLNLIPHKHQVNSTHVTWRLIFTEGGHGSGHHLRASLEPHLSLSLLPCSTGFIIWHTVTKGGAGLSPKSHIRAPLWLDLSEHFPGEGALSPAWSWEPDPSVSYFLETRSQAVGAGYQTLTRDSTAFSGDSRSY